MFVSRISTLPRIVTGYLLCLFVFVIPEGSHAQSNQFRFRHLTVDEGLSHTDANDIIQDNQGFIWIATYFGLNRYDGYSIKKYYNNNEPLNNAFKNRVHCLFADNNGHIWLGTEGGIQRLDPATGVYTDYTGKFSADRIWMPDNKTMYVLTGSRLIKFSIKEHSLINQSLDIRASDFVPYNNELYVASEQSILIINADGKITPLINLPEHITSLHVDRQGNLLIGTKTQVCKAIPQQGIYCFPVDYPVRQIVEDANGNYWVNTAPSVLQLDQQLHLRQVIQAGAGPYDLNTGTLSRIMIDRSQCLWIATFSGGVNYCDLNQKQFYTLSGSYVRAIHAIQGKLWIGTMGKGLNRYDPVSRQFLQFTKLESDNVLALATDNEQRLWVGTYAGVQVIDPVLLRNLQLKGDECFPHFMIENLAKDCYGNIWFGNHTHRFGVIWKDDQQVYRVRYFGEGYFILPDNKKPEIFVSSTHGLHRYRVDRSGNILDTVSYSGLSSNYTYPVCKQNDSVYWVGTMGGGLNCLRLKNHGDYQIDHYNTQYDIFKDVEAMEIDGQGNIWMGGNGLQRLNPDKQVLTKYDKNDGLQGNSFKVGASFKDENGRLYFGGINGLNIFDPDAIGVNEISAKPVITDILVNNTQALASREQLQLNYQQNNFVIYFSAMHFANPLQCRYRYRMIGFDKDWIYTDGQQAFYSNLDYKNYRFVVQATNNDGLWSGDEAIISLTIKPPWWKSLIAKIFYTTLALSVLIGIYIYQARWYRLKRELAVRELKEAKREEMHQQQLLFFTNISHEFRTPLTLIIGPLEVLIRNNEDPLLQMMLRNAKRLINLISELMNFKKIADNVIRLQVHPLDVREFCKGIAAEFEEIAVSRRINFEFKDLPELNGLFDTQVLEKIIYNLLNNAFKYTEEGGTVVLEIFTDHSLFQPLYRNGFKLSNDTHSADRYIYFRVADTGIGISEESIRQIFDRYFRINNHHLGSGIGLTLVKSLTQLHKGEIYVYSEKNRGTEIIIAIPWGAENYTTSAIQDSAQLEMIDQSVLLPYQSKERLPINRSTGTILIVDDNKELRLFLAQLLGKDYVIIEAENGQQALEVALANIPDLIISDIMMPLMNGIDFCKAVKDRFETRHIPIILLSAKDALDTKIAGLESGADFYFAKPLSIELLLLTVQNIFHSRNVLKETYTKNYLSEATELVHSEKDKELFNKLLNIIEENIEDPALDVDFLCRSLFISRTMLYQKIKSISDQSVAEFIRTIRLKRSIFIMTHEDITMSEVALRVGLHSSSNFSRAFKKEYGKSPMQFMQSLRKS